jgi:circadian clock protein KaiB
VEGEFDATLRRFEARLADARPAEVVLVLYVAGASDLSVRAIGQVRALCERHLAGHFKLAVVDVHRDPDMTERHNVLATPTLIKELPLPKRRLVGDLSDTPMVLTVLGIATGDQVQEAMAHESAG